MRGWFKDSFIGKILAINVGVNSALLENSRVIYWLMKVIKRIKYLIAKVLNFNLFQNLKKSLLFFSVKMASLIGITAALTNILLLSILRKEIGLFGWLVRIIFSLICLAGLFCPGNYQDIKEASLILKLTKFGNNKSNNY